MPDKTVWVCTPEPGKSLRLEDIPIEEYTPIEEALDVSYLQVIAAPLRTTKMTLGVYQLVCRRLGLTAREGMPVGKMLAMFELVEDDRPLSYDGGLPAPLADESTTV